MARRRTKRNALKVGNRSRRRAQWPWLVAAGVILVTVGLYYQAIPERLRTRAQSAEKVEKWPEAYQAWHAFNETRNARSATYLAEAKAALAANFGSKAESALRNAIQLDPSNAEAWYRLLELLRVENRTAEVLENGREALQSVTNPGDRLELLRRLTLASLIELPDEVARPLLERWIAADPADIDAQVAKLNRVVAMPRVDDPDRSSRVERLKILLETHPERISVRESLINELADSGEIEQGRALLEAWPHPRDARFERLKGRWALEYDNEPATAVSAFLKVVAAIPHDWKSYYRLARALEDPAEAGKAAARVAELRELLDQASLTSRVENTLKHLDQPQSRLDLAKICERAGLIELANAWKVEANELTKQKPGGTLLRKHSNSP